MARQYDAATKYLVEAHPSDWLTLAGLPSAGSLEVVNADLASITAAADKVIRVGGPAPYVAHLEFQSGADAGLDRRVLAYNVMLGWRHRLPVRSVIMLLRPQAGGPSVTGHVREQYGRETFGRWPGFAAACADQSGY